MEDCTKSVSADPVQTIGEFLGNTNEVDMTEQSHLLPKDMTEKNRFANLLSWIVGNRIGTECIIGDPIGRLISRRTKMSPTNGCIHPILLWLLSTTGCLSHLVMANFLDRDAYCAEQSVLDNIIPRSINLEHGNQMTQDVS